MAGANAFMNVIFGIAITLVLFAAPVIILIANKTVQRQYPRWTSIAIVVAMVVVLIANSRFSPLFWYPIATLVGWLPCGLGKHLSRPYTACLAWLVFAIAFLSRSLASKNKRRQETEQMHAEATSKSAQSAASEASDA